MLRSKERGFEMYKHQEQFLKVTLEYNRQINLLLGMAEKSDRKRIEQLMPILQKLKSSLQKMVNQQEKFKQCVQNSGKYKALLQPYISVLDETRAEIEKVGEKA